MACSILAIAGAVTLLLEGRAATQIVLRVTTNVSCQSGVATPLNDSKVWLVNSLQEAYLAEK